MNDPYDCKGGPGTTEPSCGACITCLLLVIEEKDARIKKLEETGAHLYERIGCGCGGEYGICRECTEACQAFACVKCGVKP